MTIKKEVDNKRHIIVEEREYISLIKTIHALKVQLLQKEMQNANQ